MHLNVLDFFCNKQYRRKVSFLKRLLLLLIIIIILLLLLLLLLYYYILYYYYIIIPCEQRLLSWMAFSVYEVTREACLSRSWLMTLKTLKVMHKDKPLLAGYTYHSISVSSDAT